MNTSALRIKAPRPFSRWLILIFGIVMTLTGLTLEIPGIKRARLGGSWYYLLAGTAMVVAGILIARARTLLSTGIVPNE